MAIARESHDDALNQAWERLSVFDPAVLAANSGADLEPGTRRLSLKVLDKKCLIDIDARTVSYASRRTGEVSAHLRVLILHYIEGAGNAQLANRLISYREFEGGALYYSAFKSRTIDVIIKEFSRKPDLLKHIGDAVGAEPLKMGSVGFKAYFFPKMPIVVVMWLGDEEVPASANILFDANAGKLLPTEDLSVVGGVLCNWLVQLERA